MPYLVIFLTGSLLLLGPADLKAAVKAVYESGKEVEGELVRMRNNTLYLTERGIDLRLSLQNVQALYFARESGGQRPEAPPELVLAGGDRISIRRVVRVRSGEIVVETRQGETENYEVGSLAAIFFGRGDVEHEVIYRNSAGDTRTILYRQEEKPVFDLNGDTWVAVRSGDYMTCGAEAGNGPGQRLGLWKLPPQEGGDWSVKRAGDTVGRGGWGERKGEGRAKIEFSHRISGEDISLRVEGEVLTEPMLASRVELSTDDEAESWQLVSRPAHLSLKPCFTYSFLRDFLSRKNEK